MQKAVIIKLKGGMGNQMFQYAFAQSLKHAANKQNIALEILFDASGYDEIPGKDTFRKLLLSHLNTRLEIASPTQCEKARNPFGPISRMLRMLRNTITKEYYVGYLPELLHSPYKAYYEGYWQTEKYFIDIAGEIRKDFTLKTPLGTAAAQMLERIQSDEHAVSIFYRRTDYVGHPDLDIGEQDYQIRAIEKMTELVKDPHFYVMSDDIAWVKAHAQLPQNTVFVSSPLIKDYEEIILTSACRHSIIPNSTFAWWGAWLNQNPTKQVIMPKVWSKNDNETRRKDIAPGGWIRL